MYSRSIKKIANNWERHRFSWFIMEKLLTFISKLIAWKARLLFKQANPSPDCPDYELMEVYQKKYSNRWSLIDYNSDSLKRKGEDRAKRLLSLIPSEKNRLFLELGCWDGMVCYTLQQFDNVTVAIDCRSVGFDERAKCNGVSFIKMDVHHLLFEDETFDVVFSFDAFEHFANPETVLEEIIRILKPGGYIYLEFGPLFMSPGGAHLYRQITIPYCHLLFSKDSLQRFANSKGLGILDFDIQLNKYSLVDFRNLWLRYSNRIKRVRYLEVPVLNKSFIDLIEKYPSCFKNKTRNFDNLIIKNVRVLFQKIK